MPRVTGLKNPIGDSLHSRDANNFSRLSDRVKFRKA